LLIIIITFVFSIDVSGNVAVDVGIVSLLLSCWNKGKRGGRCNKHEVGDNFITGTTSKLTLVMKRAAPATNAQSAAPIPQNHALLDAEPLPVLL
jgi:hypothetical protein